MTDTLNGAQLRAVEAEGPVLCCACPGSGKTKVLVAKVRHILRTHPDPWIIMTTFSRDAADEMLERISGKKHAGRHGGALTPEQMGRLTIGTFHALAIRQLKEVGQVGRILSEIEIRHLIYRAMSEVGVEMPDADADAVIARCKADPGFARENPDFALLTEAYVHHQKVGSAQDFTDLILLANKLMSKGKLKPLRATHILSDETQDIDSMQYDWLMHHVAQGAVLTAVGDDDQSVYGFRRSLGFRGMMDIVSATGAEIVTLDTNYRSTAGIVATASKLIAYNVDRVPKNIQAARGPGPVPRVVALPKGESQAMWIIRSLDEVCRRNEVPKTLPDREPYRFGVRPGQAAVLARTNAQLGDIEQVFIRERVPYVRTGRSFWDVQVLQVYLNLLESMVRQEPMGIEIALRWARVGDNDMRALMQASNGNLWSLVRPESPLPVPPLKSAEAKYFFTLGRGWASKLSGRGSAQAARGPIHGAAEWMSKVLTKTCAQDEDCKPENEPSRRDARNLERLETARDMLDRARGSLMMRIRLMKEDDAAEIPRVLLTTCHAAKGLEWQHVYIVDVHAGSIPKVEESATDEEVAEERRVFYVAMTRARDRLTILARKDKPVSDFLAETELPIERIPSFVDGHKSETPTVEAVA